MRFHLVARNVEGRHLASLGAHASREQAERAAKFLRKHLPAFVTVAVEEDHQVTA